MKKKWLEFVAAYSLIYTAVTLLNSALYLGSGVYEDPSGNWHELDRAIILLIGFAAYGLCTRLPVALPALRYLLAYLPCQLLVFGYVWFTGLREPLAQTAYRDVWINFTGLFLVFCLVELAVRWKRRKQQGRKTGGISRRSQ